MSITTEIATIQSTTILGVSAILSIAAIGTAIAFAMLGGKFLDVTARQPEMAPMLLTRMLMLAGLLDGVSMIGVGICLYFSLANPFLSSFLSAISQVGA
ncbi:MAG: F0F1 ATP synthase subunit C [Pseudomonadota bacterium]|nr:F0F1 ATP synthase subunit C [Pseudomonadota bacterium]